MSIRLAVVGFRHGHIFSLLRQAQEMEGIEVVTACEEDPTTRAEVVSKGAVAIDYDDFDQMLATVDCDAVGIGDYFGKRGSLAIRALSAGKHVLSDKPLCASLNELDQIEALCAEKGLKVGCALTLRDSPQFIGVRDLVRQGTIGEIHAISFNGQHPLLLTTRPQWYFEPGKHGGTINDIGVHAMDAIPWITGLSFAVVNAARCWNAFATGFPHFQDAGQMMLTMENGCGVLGDVSYSSPDSGGYSLPFYWRMTFWGRDGVIETYLAAKGTSVLVNGESALRTEPLPAGDPGGYLKAFVNDVNEELGADAPCTASVLRASRVALTIQKAADSGACHLSLRGKSE